METKEGRRNRYTFAGAEYFKHMQEIGLYTLDVKEIEERNEKAGFRDVFKRKIVEGVGVRGSLVLAGFELFAISICVTLYVRYAIIIKDVKIFRLIACYKYLHPKGC